jgi:hypothetical protein
MFSGMAKVFQGVAPIIRSYVLAMNSQRGIRKHLMCISVKYTKAVRKVMQCLIGYPYKFVIMSHISLQHLYSFCHFFKQRLHTSCGGLQSFNVTDMYKTVMIKLLNHPPKLHRYRGHCTNAATRKIKVLYECTNTMNNLPKYITQYGFQILTGFQLLCALSSKLLIKKWDPTAVFS